MGKSIDWRGVAKATLETMPFLDSICSFCAVISQKFSWDNLTWITGMWKQKEFKKKVWR